MAYGGSPMAPELIHRTREVLPHVKLVQGYGLSETGFLTGLQDHEHTEDRLMSRGRRFPGSTCGSWTSQERKLAPGSLVNWWLRGANVMRGYWKNAAATALAFRDGLFRTGRHRLSGCSRVFLHSGPREGYDCHGGENVYSGEVEAVIYAHPAVREAAVFGIPDPQWGELVMACVVLKPEHALSGEELITHCRRSLANYKIPRRVEFSETELPKSGSGKILKRMLRERFWTHQKRAVG